MEAAIDFGDYNDVYAPPQQSLNREPSRLNMFLEAQKDPGNWGPASDELKTLVADYVKLGYKIIKDPSFSPEGKTSDLEILIASDCVLNVHRDNLTRAAGNDMLQALSSAVAPMLQGCSIDLVENSRTLKTRMDDLYNPKKYLEILVGLSVPQNQEALRAIVDPS